MVSIKENSDEEVWCKDYSKKSITYMWHGFCTTFTKGRTLQLRNEFHKFTPKVSLQSLLSTELNIMEKAIKNPKKAEETIASAETPAHTNSLAGYGASLGPHGPGPPAWQ